ncbi:hypothetical protein [Kerstersia similis]|uniref:hypothetical protein n=1 Tax=Kerstersia similis TaxID=206505 RepID=UPI0039EF7E05
MIAIPVIPFAFLGSLPRSPRQIRNLINIWNWILFETRFTQSTIGDSPNSARFQISRKQEIKASTQQAVGRHLAGMTALPGSPAASARPGDLHEAVQAGSSDA